MHRLVIIFFLLLISGLSGSAQDNSVQTCRHNRQQIQGSRSTSALNSRSDSVDIRHYLIDLDITDFTTKIIRGNTRIDFRSRVNGMNRLDLDLLKLTVDSVKLNGSILTYSYNDTLLKVDMPSMNINDSASVTVYYKGLPQGDASGWGGFYFSGGYAFNLGVGFAADPHNYGRVWFPCFDNFVERSTYTFRITTNNGKLAYCNGVLINDTTIGGTTRIRTWKLNEEIPTYLASVAVAGYTQVSKTFTGMQGPVPVILASLPADTNNLKNSFINLDEALTAFENGYGPYRWERIGFTLVPFSSGAMEHATNIAYPRAAANGNLSNETLMAHEFAHHWWGDLATCRTAEDMWLNEGWASYSEHLFTEHVYGTQAYKNSIRANHEEVLHYAHVKEGGYRAVSGVPHNYTYGDHVYLKGADVAHTLRGYMGDSLFFVGIKAYLDSFAFKDASSEDFRNVLSSSTGIPLTDFFNNWVFGAGFPHFSVDSFNVVPSGGQFQVTTYVKQKLTGAASLYANVPLTLNFRDAQNILESNKNIIVNGASSSYAFTLPFEPVYAGINLDEKISDATAPEMKVVKATGTNNFANARMNLTVRSIADSVFIKIDHNYTAPDPFKVNTGQFRLSPNRYWKVDGVLKPGFDASARVYYDGRGMTSGGNGNLDNLLITATEDSVVLLYRRSAADDWSLCTGCAKNMVTNVNDKYGFFTIDTLRLGEYALAMLRYPLSDNVLKLEAARPRLYPNPGTDILNAEGLNTEDFKILDINGRACNVPFIKNGGDVQFNTTGLSAGVYFLELNNAEGKQVLKWVKY